MRVAHSFWIKPTIDRWGISGQLEQNLYLYAISLSYLKKLGVEVVMHTDTDGLKYFEKFPYDNIYTTLDWLNDNKVSHRFWASGKVIAQKAEPLGSYHIDGDVFLKTREVIDYLNSINSDILTQGPEDFTYAHLRKIYEFNYKEIRNSLVKNKPAKLDYDKEIESYNCGIVRFNDADLKEQYIRGYLQMLQELHSDKNFIRKIENNKEYCPDLVIEQTWLANCSSGHKSKFLFESPSEMQSKAVSLGYQHILGSEKYSEYNRYIAEKTLQQLDSNLYEIIKKTIYNG